MPDPRSGEAGSIPARAAEHDQVAQLVDARRSERRALRDWEFDSPLGHWTLQARQVPNGLSYGRCARFDTGACNSRVGQCSAGFHKPGSPGATPGPATTGYANWHSGEVESLVPVGSTPTSVTDNMIPWSNGEGAWVTTRKAVVRLHPGSLVEKRSVGVLAAHLLGKEEDPVQLRDGPLDLWAGMFPGGDGPLQGRCGGFDSHPVHCKQEG